MSSRQAKPIKAKRVGTARRPQPKPLLGREAKILLLIGLPIVLLFAVLAVRNAGGDEAPAVSVEQQRLLVREDSPALGPADAPVSLVVFSDFQCPACASAEPLLKDLMTRHEGKIRIAFRHNPLRMHRWAVHAVQAAEAAGAQGKFWEMHDLLFSHQQHLQLKHLREYAEQLELDMVRFSADLGEHTYLQRVREHILSGEQSGVRGTPGFFVDGKLVDVSFGLDRLFSAAEAALKRHS